MTNVTDDISTEDLEQLMMVTINTGATLKDIHGISDDVMENIYAHAYQYYNEGRLDEAEKFFQFLCMYDLKNADYFIGLGAVYQLKKNYIKACDIYSLAFMLAENNYSPVFFAGQCQLLMGNVAKALQCFDIICKRCDDEKLVAKANAYLVTIRENRNDLTEEANEDEGGNSADSPSS